jgi:LysR family transcriptional regulator, carnitine catabolism transcriptional activator
MPIYLRATGSEEILSADRPLQGTEWLTASWAHGSKQHRHQQVIDANSAEITRQVAEAQADLGIGTPLGDTERLECQPLLYAPIGVLYKPALLRLRTPLAAAQLKPLPLLKEPEDTSIMQALRAHGSTLVAGMAGGTEVSSLALQLSFAQAGVGVAVVSALGASHPAAAGLRFVPLKPAVKRTVFLMRRRDRALAPPAAALVDAMRTALDGAALHRAVRRVGSRRGLD